MSELNTAKLTESELAGSVAVIAAVCHEVNRSYCEAIGDFSLSSWEMTPEQIKQSVYSGVLYRLTNPLSTPKDMHSNWLKDKTKAGWVYGPVKDAEKMTHPCIAAYSELPEAQRIKDNLFIGVVDTMRKVLSV